MGLTIREHAGAALVAAGVIAAALAVGLFEPLGYAAASIVIWAALIAGLVGRVLPVGPVSRMAAAAGLSLAAIALLSAVSLAWANDQGRAFEEAVRVSFYLGLFTLAVCTANPAGRNQWLAGLTLGLGAVSIIAVVAYLQPGLIGSQQSDVPNAVSRLSYPVGYWNGAGALLAAAAVLLAHAGLRAPTRVLRSVAIALIPLAGLGIWLAGSRGGGAAVAIGLVVLIAASPNRTKQALTIAIALAGTAVLILIGDQLDHLRSAVIDSSRRTDGDWMSVIVVGVAVATGGVAWLLDATRPAVAVSRRVALAALVLVAATAVVGVIAADPIDRFDEFKQPPPASGGVETEVGGVSSHGRWQYWNAALDAFESAPLDGVGAGGFENYWGQHPSVLLYVRNPHSLPLQEAAELGIPGIALFVVFAVAIGTGLRRRLAQGRVGDVGVLTAVLAAGAVGALVDWTWEIPAVFGPAVVCAGLLTASAPSRRLARDGYWLGIGAVAAAWVAMFAGALVVLAELELRQSRDAAASSRIDDAIDRARAARTLMPWSADPYTQLALLEEERGSYEQALTYLLQARERDTNDWRLALIESRLQAERGDGPAARTAMGRAQGLSPFTPLPFGGVTGQG
jgi:hypothetical protein